MITEMIIIVMLVDLSSSIVLIYKNSQLTKYNKNIIDSIPALVLIYKKSVLFNVNKSFFNYFYKYSSLKEFLDENESISNFFEEE